MTIDYEIRTHLLAEITEVHLLNHHGALLRGFILRQQHQTTALRLVIAYACLDGSLEFLVGTLHFCTA